MQFMKRLLLTITTVALMATLATLLAPKTVHALVATLIRDVDNPAAPLSSSQLAPLQRGLCLVLRLSRSPRATVR